MKRFLAGMLATALVTPAAWAQNWQPGAYKYEYNEGPQAAAPDAAHARNAKEIMDLYAEQPENKYISDEISPKQKFRYAFGAMMLRTNFAPNSIKIFAIGQDAVDDAELVKLPGTGTGYSTRVQIIANFHGVDTSLATSNASFQTIKGQYGAFDHIYVEKDKDGVEHLKQSKYVDNYLWTMFNGAQSPIVTHREKVWEWQLKNNLQSLRLIMLFGAASHDAFAEFLNKRGFRVPTKMDPKRLENIRVPESDLVFAGGNNEFPKLMTKNGDDIYQMFWQTDETTGKQVRIDYTNPNQQATLFAALKRSEGQVIPLLDMNGGGLHGSGIVHPAQLGGYDMNGVEKQVNGQWVKTHSLKGLKLSDGTVIQTDIAFVASPHPTSLSTNAKQASKTITQIFAGVKDLIGPNNPIAPDQNDDGTFRVNGFAKGIEFDYGRASLPRRVVPFGAPRSILLPQSSADRMGPQVLVSEPPSRDELRKARKKLEDIFDADLVKAAKAAQPIEPMHPDDIWSQHSRQEGLKYQADPGPGAEYAALMVDKLKPEVLKLSKAPVLGFFAHYRGTFNQPKVVILHDSTDLEDRNTFRAATGRRGQFLNGLMRDLGVELNQLVITTAPVDMFNATPAELEAVREKTAGYREALLRRVLIQNTTKAIFTDGPMAKVEATRILQKLGWTHIKVIDIPRTEDNSADMKVAGAAAQAKVPDLFGKTFIGGAPGAIPVAHLPWNSRDWERFTSGTVIEAKAPFTGKTYLVVTPDFVFNQKLKPRAETVQGVKNMEGSLQGMHIPLVNEE